MSADPRFVYEQSMSVAAAPTAPPRWEMAIPVGRAPPMIEEWLRASRARLLRRYGGLKAAAAGRTRSGR